MPVAIKLVVCHKLFLPAIGEFKHAFLNLKNAEQLLLRLEDKNYSINLMTSYYLIYLIMSLVNNQEI